MSYPEVPAGWGRCRHYSGTAAIDRAQNGTPMALPHVAGVGGTVGSSIHLRWVEWGDARAGVSRDGEDRAASLT